MESPDVAAVHKIRGISPQRTYGIATAVFEDEERLVEVGTKIRELLEIAVAQAQGKQRVEVGNGLR